MDDGRRGAHAVESLRVLRRHRLPHAACNLRRLTHAPDIVLLYESGTSGGADRAGLRR
jgi:hypothetical protein